MFRLGPWVLIKLISGTVASLVVGFAVVFSYLLLQLAGLAASASSFFAGFYILPYLSIEGAFLAVVLAGAYGALHRRRSRPAGPSRRVVSKRVR
jgi:hypothetical protein